MFSIGANLRILLLSIADAYPFHVKRFRSAPLFDVSFLHRGSHLLFHRAQFATKHLWNLSLPSGNIHDEPLHPKVRTSKLSIVDSISD